MYVLYTTAYLDQSGEMKTVHQSIRQITEVHRKHFRIHNSKCKFDLYGNQLLKVNTVEYRQMVSHCRLIANIDACYLTDIRDERTRSRLMASFLAEQKRVIDIQLKRYNNEN
jgi:hypothetical protein